MSWRTEYTIKNVQMTKEKTRVWSPTEWLARCGLVTRSQAVSQPPSQPKQPVFCGAFTWSLTNTKALHKHHIECILTPQQPLSNLTWMCKQSRILSHAAENFYMSLFHLTSWQIVVYTICLDKYNHICVLSSMSKRLFVCLFFYLMQKCFSPKIPPLILPTHLTPTTTPAHLTSNAHHAPHPGTHSPTHTPTRPHTLLLPIHLATLSCTPLTQGT